MISKHLKSVLLAILALLAFNAPVPAFSQMKEMPMKNHVGMHGQMMEMGTICNMDNMMGACIEHADKFGLTDEQMTKMKHAQHDMQKKQLRFHADVKIAEIELAEIIEVKDFDMEKATSAVKKIAEIKTAHQLEMLKNMKEMRSNLTDDQFKNMQKMMQMKGDKNPTQMNMKKHHNRYEGDVK